MVFKHLVMAVVLTPSLYICLMAGDGAQLGFVFDGFATYSPFAVGIPPVMIFIRLSQGNFVF